MAADLAISLATPFLEYLITPIGRQCGYILFYKRYLKELEEGVVKLKEDLEGVEHKCEAARHNAMSIETKVEKWIDGVNDAVKEADRILGHNRARHKPGANTVVLHDDFQSWFRRCVCLNHHPVRRSQEAVLQGADTIRLQDDDDEVPAAGKKFYLNPVTCYRKGRKAKKTKLTIDQLKDEIKELGNDFSYEDLTRPIYYSTEDYLSFASRDKIVKDIMDTLTNASISVIGVWGMGGVGKSVLMKEVAKLAKENNLFDDVAIANVSQNPDVKRIQGDIAVWLGLKLEDGDTERGRAFRLRKRLMNDRKSTTEPPEEDKHDAVTVEEKQHAAASPEEKQYGNIFGRASLLWMKSSDSNSSTKPLIAAPEKQDQVHVEEILQGKLGVKQKQVLIILDDLWRGLDLEAVGIPQDAGAVKLILTSRSKHVLSSEMGCYHHNIFNLEALNDNEAWKLFESIVGERVGLDDTSIKIGKEVVRKCSGLPIVLKAIAKTLKNCSLPDWRDALEQLSGSKDAYSTLELSFKHLESYELKSLFLVCALTDGARISLKDMLYYGMGLGLFKGASTVRNARDKMRALIHSLQASSLLLEYDNLDHDHVKMHDVVREVAIRIASRDQYSFLITDVSELKEMPREKLKNSKAISIPYVNLQKLPGGWECPELRMFLLYRSQYDSPIHVSDSIFEGMKELKVLDFSGRWSDSLPSSVQSLENLSTLCLDWSPMMDLSIIGKIKQLEVLTFRGSKIDRLPKQIGELTDLKVLDLCECTELEIIEPQVLGKLTRLEELHMRGSSFNQWEDEGAVQPSNAKLSELNHMRNLSSIDIHIHDPSRIPQHLQVGSLVEYTILIGDVWSWSPKYQESRTLKIKLDSCRNNFLREKWLQDMLKRTQDLHLDGLKGRKNSIHELCLDGFQELKHLHVQNSAAVQCVTRSLKWFPCVAFTILESLFLENLTELKKISGGPLVAESFSRLKVIKVKNCGKLKNLFCYSMLKGLSKLEEIEVTDCEMMQEIVTIDSVATSIEVVVLQALRRIKFHNLPNILRFCSSQVEANQTERRPSSEIISEDTCIPTDTHFFSEQLVSFPQLESLILSSLPKLKSIWQNDSPVKVDNLKRLEVRSCTNLSTVIPCSFVPALGNLESLLVRDCGSVQAIFECCHSNEFTLGGKLEILPRLETLELYDLPDMSSIWPRDHRLQKSKLGVFQSLKSVSVENCNSLENLFPAVIFNGLRQVTEITMKNCEKMKEVMESDGGEGKMKTEEDRAVAVFDSLVRIELTNLPKMVTFIRGDESISFPSLKELEVAKCPKMQSFCLPKTTDQGGDESLQLCFFDNKILVPKLVLLYLISLGSLEKIWDDQVPKESFCQLETLGIADCQKLVDVFPSNNMTGTGRLRFQNLKVVIIRACTSLKGSLFKFVWEGDNKKGFSLPELEKLWLLDLPSLNHVLEPSSHVVVGFPNLVDITIRDCKSVIDVFPIATATTLSKLEELDIRSCGSMRQVFGKEEGEEEDDELMDTILIPRLRSITCQRLDSLISLFLGTSCVLDFPSLENLDISWCPNLNTFVQRHITDEESTPLAKEGAHYLFDEQVEFPNLQKMELYQLSSLKTIWKINELLPGASNSCCSRLKSLIVSDCKDLQHIFPASLARNLVQLEELKVEICGVEEIVMLDDGTRSSESDGNSAPDDYGKIAIKNCEKLNEVKESDGGEGKMKTVEDRAVAVFDSLVRIELTNLPNMVTFVRGDHESVSFPSLKELEVVKCPEMQSFCLQKTTDQGDDDKILVPEQSFCQLESLIIRDCQKLVDAFPSNYHMTGTGQRLRFQNLKVVIIRECTSLKGSLFKFVWEGDNKKAFSLPELEKLWLFDLPSLNHVLEPSSHVVVGFPNLVDITIRDCKSLTDVFPIATATTLSKLEELEIVGCGSIRQVFGKEEGEEEEDDEMMGSILIPRLRSITCQSLDSLISLFLGTSCILDFPSLENLDISWCPNLNTFVQRHISDRESTLFPKQGAHYLFDDQVEFPNLQKMELYQLSSLKTIWKINELLPGASNSCCSRLKSLIVSDCKDLQHIFPASLARSLVQLEELKVEICGVEEIVMLDDGTSSRDQSDGNSAPDDDELFFFPQLTSLTLDDLPNLRSFFRGSNSCTWPALKTLWMWDCNNMRMFTSNISSENTNSTRQSLFLAEQVIPLLERMNLVEEDATMIMNGEFQDDLFNNLKHVALSYFHNERADFPSRFLLEKFQKLERLVVYCSSLEDIFPDESLSPDEIILYKQGFAAGDHQRRPFASLRELKLNKLHNLKHVWKADTILAKILEGVQVLEVWECPILTTIFPTASASFGNITKMDVCKCNGLRELMTASAATSLLKLTQLDIYDCEKIEEIVAASEHDRSKSAEDDSELVICFRELKHLGLRRLPSLTSFSSANCTFEFPSLEEVIVIQCPSMNIFSHSSAAAPKLSKVLLAEQEEEGKVRWDGDLNTTIQNLPK